MGDPDEYASQYEGRWEKRTSTNPYEQMSHNTGPAATVETVKDIRFQMTHGYMLGSKRFQEADCMCAECAAYREQDARDQEEQARTAAKEADVSLPEAEQFSRVRRMFADLVERERATEADCRRAVNAMAAGTITEQQLTAKWAPLAIEDGATVTFRGLKSREELNGREATVIGFKANKGRFAVQINGADEVIAVKPNSLRKAASGAEVLARKWGTVVAELVSGYLKCTRCGEPCTIGSKCRVPHPVNMREDLGSMSGPNGIRSNWGCRACNQSYTDVTPWNRSTNDNKLSCGEQHVEGAKWCFAGEHTTAPLLPTDERRVQLYTVSLVSGPNLQEEIDALPDDVQILTITSSSGFYDEDTGVSLERRLADLTELQLVDVSFTKVILNEALTPSIRSLRLQNVPDECELVLELPQLKDVSIHYLRSCDETVNTMLDRATALEKFDSYKLWVYELHFASNHLVDVDLHRSDSLDTLTMYAPNLRSLGLQGCFGLDNIVFHPTHPTLSASLPSNHRIPRLEVNAVNANLGRRAQKALREHPCASSSRMRHQGMPTEEMFANMGMGGTIGGFGDDDSEDYSESDDDYPDLSYPDVMAQMMAAMGGGGTGLGGMPADLMAAMMESIQGTNDNGTDSDSGESVE
eukprot:SAG31_NODE_4095_length_3592_cov_2.576009_3_plen_639_part_00